MNIIDRDAWDVRRYHGTSHPAAHAWKLTDDGILVEGEDSERRTEGEPLTLRRIFDKFGGEIHAACHHTGVPKQLLAAVIATESGGRPHAEREEAHLKDISVGLTQTLTATARQLAQSAPTELGLATIGDTTPVPGGGSIDSWRDILRVPATAINLGAWYLATANKRWNLQFDPVLLYAAFNAGSPRENDKRPWGVHYYRKEFEDGRVADAMNHFVAWYGDARAVCGVC